MTATQTGSSSNDHDIIGPIATFRAPLERSERVLIVGGALVLLGWLIAIPASLVPIGYRFPIGLLLFVGSAIASLVTSAGAVVLAIVAITLRRSRLPQSVSSVGRRLVVPLSFALVAVGVMSLAGEKVLAIVGLAIH